MCDIFMHRLSRDLNGLDPPPSPLFVDDNDGIVPLDNYLLMWEVPVVKMFEHLRNDTYADPVTRSTAAAYMLYLNFTQTDLTGMFRRRIVISDGGDEEDDPTFRLVYQLMRSLPAFIQRHGPECLQPDRVIIMTEHRPVIPSTVMDAWRWYKQMTMDATPSSLDLEVGRFMIDHFVTYHYRYVTSGSDSE
jgi:hypothetical protein